MTDHGEEDDDRRTDDGPESYRHTFDPATDSVCVELVRAVAVLNDTDPCALPVLADTLDPEALELLVQPRPDGQPRETDTRIRFEYNGHRIRLTTDGTITIGLDQS